MTIEDELEFIAAQTNDFTKVLARFREWKLDLAKRLEEASEALLDCYEIDDIIAELRK